MADEAAVTLSASDEISAPVMRAVASLQQLQAAIDDISKTAKGLAPSAGQAGVSIDSVSNAAVRSVGSHTAAHKAMNLLSAGMAEIAGASPAAHAGIRVMDSLVYQLATNASRLSFGMVGAVAAIVSIGVAMRASAEEAKKLDDRLSGIATKQIGKVLAATEHPGALLTAEQQSTASVALASVRKEITQAKKDASDLEDKLEKIRSGAAAKQVEPLMPATLSAGGPGFRADLMASDAKKTNAALEETRTKLDAVKSTIPGLEAQFSRLSTAIKGYVQDPMQKAGLEASRTLQLMQNQSNQSADSLSKIGQALGEANPSMKTLSELTGLSVEKLREADEVAQKLDANLAKMGSDAIVAGANMVQAATEMRDRIVDAWSAIGQVSSHAAQAMGEAAMKAALGTANAWHVAVNTIIQDIVRMAIQWVEKHIIMTQVAALMHEVSTKGIIGLITGMAAIGAIAAIGAGLMAALGTSSAATESPAMSSGGGGNFGGAPASGSGVGGTAIKSANQSVVNHVSVNLGVQAIDLTGVSDIQLKNLAGRIGRIISDSAYTGQISFAGA